MATTRSSVGQAGVSVPKSKKGGSTSAPVNKPKTSGTPGGFMKPVSGGSTRKQGVRPEPKGGSGNGPNKGNSLPR